MAGFLKVDQLCAGNVAGQAVAESHRLEGIFFSANYQARQSQLVEQGRDFGCQIGVKRRSIANEREFADFGGVGRENVRLGIRPVAERSLS